ncbi:MAG: LPXTG cell wall anchor domain-containing protein [Planctomycetota bacterium]
MRRRRRRALAATCLAMAGTACAPPAPIGGDVPSLQVVAEGDSVEFGVAFPLVVVRRWTDGSAVRAFDAAGLAPLSVELVSSSRRDDGMRVEETLRLRARAFVRDSVTLAPSFEVRMPDGSTREVAAPPTTLRVRSALGSSHGAEVELPGDLLLEPTRRMPWLLAAGVAIAGLGVWFARRRRTPVESPPAPPPVPATDHRAEALAQLRMLRQQPLASDEEVRGVYVAATAILRADLVIRGGIAAHEMTSDEILAVRKPAPHLARVLRAADLVKFARHTPTAGQARAMLDDAEASLAPNQQSGV